MFEEDNLKSTMKGIVDESVATVFSKLDDPEIGP
jgi:hypothetical protein